jgi:hypothetical protein
MQNVAKEAGVADRVSFEIAKARVFRSNYDLVTFFDCLRHGRFWRVDPHSSRSNRTGRG